jgi:hypothetical protein
MMLDRLGSIGKKGPSPEETSSVVSLTNPNILGVDGVALVS